MLFRSVEVLSVLGWVLSFYAAQWFAPQLAELLPIRSASSSSEKPSTASKIQSVAATRLLIL